MPKAIIDLKRLLGRAEECRVLAGIAGEETVAGSYMKLAESYEAIAEEERKMMAVRAARTVVDDESPLERGKRKG